MPPDADFSHPAWQAVEVASLAYTWRGDTAPAALRTTARMAWTPDELWVGFECAYTELDVDVRPHCTVERHGLWERDVCEAFIQSPQEGSASSYKEFEVAPTGQWFDAAIRRPRLDIDWEWNAGLRSFAAIDHERGVWRAVMAVPFAAFGGAPTPDRPWRINLFRVSRLDGVRQHLAFAPTGTDAPDFHVPGCFVPLQFTRESDCA